MHALATLAFIFGVTVAGLVVVIGLLVASGHTVPFPTAPAAWRAGGFW